MKTITCLVLFFLSFNVVAAPLADLETALDNYNYAITVDWDQKDQAFYLEKTNEFVRQISDLVLKQGLTQDQVISFIEAKAPTRAMANDVRLRMSHVSSASPETLVQAIQESSKDMIARGANWDGETWGTIGIVAGIAAVLGFAIWFGVTYKCVKEDYRQKAGCDSANCYEKYCSDYEHR